MKIDLSKRPTVFVSYALDGDGPKLAHDIARHVNQLGGEAKLATEFVRASSQLRTELQEVISESAATVLIVTDQSMHSPSQQSEWSLVQAQLWDNPEFKIIPIVVDDASVPPFLSRMKRIELKDARDVLDVVLEQEFESDNNSIDLTEFDRDLMQKRYASLKAQIQENVSSLPSKFRSSTARFLKDD